jgi:hypothetical protein
MGKTKNFEICRVCVINKGCKRSGPDISNERGEACKEFNTLPKLQEKASEWLEWKKKEPETIVRCVDNTESRVEVELQIKHSRVKVMKSENGYDGWLEKDLFFSYTEAASLHSALSSLLYGGK